MIVKTVIDEDFTNYKVPAMFIGTAHCGGKCCIENKLPLSVCQNDGWRESAPIHIDDDQLIRRFLHNGISQAIVFGGLEPFEQSREVLQFVEKLRAKYLCEAPVVIYTGYYPHELGAELHYLQQYCNIVIKFGRYIPNRPTVYDEVLGVTLASENQYAVVLTEQGRCYRGESPSCTGCRVCGVDATETEGE